MSSFSSKWLEVREPVDFAARSEEVLSAVAYYFGNDKSLRIADIGCGTGSTVRAIETFLPFAPNWHLIDNDIELLNLAKSSLYTANREFTLADLSKSLDAVFEKLPELVTTSAFLDLVSKDWLQDLVSEITIRSIPFYGALTYDGRAACSPVHMNDQKVLSAFNQHQESDKGFGPALGPKAAETAIHLFQKAGYIVTTANSDWLGNERHPVFQHLLLEGWFNAACEIQPENSEEFSKWFEKRISWIDDSASTLTVGHVDLFAVPPN